MFKACFVCSKHVQAIMNMKILNMIFMFLNMISCSGT